MSQEGKHVRIDPAIAKIRATRGMAVRIAEAFNINKAAVYQWRRVPDIRVKTVARMIKMPREQIRPDIYLTKAQQDILKRRQQEDAVRGGR